MTTKNCNFIVLKINSLRNLLMNKVTILSPEIQAPKAENLFSIGKSSCNKKIKVDFNVPDVSFNRGFAFFKNIAESVKQYNGMILSRKRNKQNCPPQKKPQQKKKEVKNGIL